MAIKDTTQTREAIIAACLWMNSSGINQGTSGNISVRTDTNRMLITPSGIPYETMTPDMLVSMPLNATEAPREGMKPSSEWPFHLALLNLRQDMDVVVHAHPAHVTALAICREAIPSCHYMIAAFGGGDVPLADYAIFGSQKLADNLTKVMADRHACIMSNHGGIVVGETLERALWRLGELEALARAYVLAKSFGEIKLLTPEEINEALAAFGNYGPR